MSTPFGTPLREAPAPSPLDPTPQNDFREQSVTVEQEQATWHAELSPKVKPIVPTRQVELGGDEWAAITIPKNTLDTVPKVFLGDDPARRRAVITNIGTEDLQLATDADKFHGTAGTNAPTVLVLVAGASIEMRSTRAVWVRAPVGSAAGITAYIERGARAQ